MRERAPVSVFQESKKKRSCKLASDQKICSALALGPAAAKKAERVLPLAWEEDTGSPEVAARIARQVESTKVISPTWRTSTKASNSFECWASCTEKTGLGKQAPEVGATPDAASEFNKHLQVGTASKAPKRAGALEGTIRQQYSPFSHRSHETRRYWH